MTYSFSRKLSAQEQLQQGAINRAKEILNTKGLGLPCKIASISNELVTVQFAVADLVGLPNMTVPIAQPLYRQEPYQVGDAGFVMSLDAQPTEVSGQVTVQPNFQANGNLGALVFFPISNVNWPAIPDPNMYLIQGPDGFIIRSIDGSVSVIGKKGTSLALAYGGNNVTISSSGIAINGTLTINGQAYMAHTHTNGNGGAPTGGVIL
jgi:hypothetical protein